MPRGDKSKYTDKQERGADTARSRFGDVTMPRDVQRRSAALAEWRALAA